MKKLKYDGAFKIGDRIKSYDFKPRPDIGESYVVGKVVAIHYAGDDPDIPYHCYEIVADEGYFVGVLDPDRAGCHYFVPMEMSMFEFDNRVSLA